MRIRTVMVALVLASAGLTGCASTDASGERASGPDPAPTTAPPPTVSPSPPPDGGGGGGGTGGGTNPTPGDPPKTPSDTFPTSWITGTVVAGGNGPCYRLETDDGTAYALYGSGGSLSRGQRIRVEVAPQAPAVNCGEGYLVRIVRVTEPGQ